MEIFSRLGIGTANWGKEYNGSKVSEKDQREILDLCMCKGIDLIDTATAYENNVLDMASSYFKIVIKVRPQDKPESIIERQPYCVMAHSFDYYEDGFLCDYSIPAGYNGKLGVSLYNPDNFNASMTGLEVIQVPYSVFDRRFTNAIVAIQKEQPSEAEIHVRSIFLRGKVLEKVKPHEAIAFCLMNPYVDRVIFGVDSADQFKENLDYFHWLDSLKVEDENILDPRRWKNE